MKLKFAALSVCIAFTMATIIGCPSKNVIAALTTTLGNAAASVAQIEGNRQLAEQLQTDTAAAVKAISSWQNGSPAQNAIQALDIVRDDLYLIPAANQYAPLITLAIGTVDSLLQLLPQPAGVKAQAANHPRVNLPNTPKTSSEFKKQWNDIVKVRGLQAAKL